MNYAKLRRFITTTIVTLVLANSAAAHDELYYSAADCKPINAGHFNGSGAEGLEWNAGRWFNADRDERQILVCPISYVRNANNLEKISVRAVVDDRHHAVFTNVTLCHQEANGNIISCANRDSFPNVFGTTTISLSVQPTRKTRFAFLEVHVPDDDDDNNSFTRNDTSSFVGYRVFRN